MNLLINQTTRTILAYGSVIPEPEDPNTQVVEVPDEYEAQLLQPGEKTLTRDDQIVLTVATPPSLPTVPNWEQLKNQLRATELFGKAFSTTNQNAWSLLLATLNSNSVADDAGRLADFEFAIGQIRLGLANDFTPEQLEQFNQILEECGFGVRVES
jgi:hypothetical protein